MELLAHNQQMAAALTLLGSPALGALTDREWLHITTASDGITITMDDNLRAMCSTGEQLLLSLLEAICDSASPLIRSVSGYLDEENTAAVRAALNVLWVRPRAADPHWLSDVALVPLLDRESLVRGGVA